jgi:MOSC domain-containing protein YiiM
MESTQEAQLVAGRGIAGDRYFAGLGEFSPVAQDPDHELSLIEIEEIESFNAREGHSFAADRFRRNVVTRDVRLGDLVGVEFELGGATVRGVRLCEPCRYLAGLVHDDVVKGMRHRCGLRAGIVRGGILRVGDPVGM